MGFSILIVFTIALVIGVGMGRRRNQLRARRHISMLEEHFAPVSAEYATLGRDLGYGFEYHLAGPIELVEGVLTLLPRYAPLYLPIARMIGRQDLLKLTYHCADMLPPGVGTLVHTSCQVSRWSAVEHDDDWQEEVVEQNGAVYNLYYFNPIIAERLRSIVPNISSIKNLNQITLDSRKHIVTFFLTPHPDLTKLDLERVDSIVFFLTGAERGGTLG